MYVRTYVRSTRSNDYYLLFTLQRKWLFLLFTVLVHTSIIRNRGRLKIEYFLFSFCPVGGILVVLVITLLVLKPRSIVAWNLGEVERKEFFSRIISLGGSRKGAES